MGQPERLYVFGVGIPVLTIIVVITTYISSKIISPPTATWRWWSGRSDDQDDEPLHARPDGMACLVTFFWFGSLLCCF